jgi:hypothetical protein
MTPQRRRRALSLEELELWLASDQAPAQGGWNVSAVDGFLAGIMIGPEPIEPKEWTRLIFGARPLGADGEAALQAVLDRHAAAAKILAKAPPSHRPSAHAKRRSVPVLGLPPRPRSDRDYGQKLSPSNLALAGTTCGMPAVAGPRGNLAEQC